MHEPAVLEQAPADTRVRREALLGVALIALASVAALYVAAVRTRAGQRFDVSSVTRHRGERATHLRFLDDLLFGGSLVLVPVIVWFGRRRLELLAVGVIAGAGSVATAEVLRTAVLTRPARGVRDVLYGPSFPSGHAAAAMACALVWLLVAPAPRGVALVIAQGVAAGVGAVAVFIPIHLPSDVVGGYLVALAWVCAAAAVVPKATEALGSRRAGAPRVAIDALLTVPAVVATVLAGTVVAVFGSHLTPPDLGAQFWLAATGVAIAAGFVLVTFSALAVREPRGCDYPFSSGRPGGIGVNHS